MSVERAFETEAVLLDELTAIVTGVDDPTISGFDAPVGSLYLRSNGTHYRKIGGVDTDWSAIDEVSGSTSVQEDVNQVAHGFSVGQVVRNNGTSFLLAQADTLENAEALGIVSDVAGVDDFGITYSGRITGLTGLIPGQVYFLSDVTAGLLQIAEPTITKPMLLATSGTEGVVYAYRAGNQSAATDFADTIKEYDSFASSWDMPRAGSDWAVTVGAPPNRDSNNLSLYVRRFVDSTETGIGRLIRVPSLATNLRIRTSIRPEIGAASGIGLKFYRRIITDNGAIGPWASTELSARDVTVAENFHTDIDLDTLANWGMTAGAVYQIQITRDPALVIDTLTGDANLLHCALEFF